jgi:hypothetical protein
MSYQKITPRDIDELKASIMYKETRDNYVFRKGDVVKACGCDQIGEVTSKECGYDTTFDTNAKMISVLLIPQDFVVHTRQKDWIIADPRDIVKMRQKK